MMLLRTSFLTVVWLTLAPHMASGLYEFDFSTALNEQSPRDLQLSGGPVPDLIAPTSTCNTFGGLEFGCDVYARVGFPTNFVDLNVTVNCFLQEGIGFNFRAIPNICNCRAKLTPSDPERKQKSCDCFICPANFGSSSFSIDCSEHLPTEAPTEAPTGVPNAAPVASPSAGTAPSAPLQPTAGTTPVASPSAGTAPAAPLQPTAGTTPVSSPSGTVPIPSPVSLPTGLGGGDLPFEEDTVSAMQMNENGTDPYVWATCVSVDCAGNCNGTCSLGCSVGAARDTCSFCIAEDLVPTVSPGAGGNPIPDIGVTTGSPAGSTGTSSATAIAVSVGKVAAASLFALAFLSL